MRLHINTLVELFTNVIFNWQIGQNHSNMARFYVSLYFYKMDSTFKSIAHIRFHLDSLFKCSEESNISFQIIKRNTEQS